MLLTISLLSACANNVIVTGKIPAPLIERLPLQAKMVYSDEFKRYSYEEEEKGRGLRSIAFGEAQITLFDSIFGALLTLVNSESIEPELLAKRLDMTITPTLLDFQYSAPRETRQNIYEIWLKYRLQVSGINDEEVADFVIKGYGKTPTALLKSADEAFYSATNIALRDAGAQIAIGFATQPLIEDYIKTRMVAQTSSSSISQTETEQVLQTIEQQSEE